MKGGGELGLARFRKIDISEFVRRRRFSIFLFYLICSTPELGTHRFVTIARVAGDIASWRRVSGASRNRITKFPYNQYGNYNDGDYRKKRLPTHRHVNGRLVPVAVAQLREKLRDDDEDDEKMILTTCNICTQFHYSNWF